MKPKARTADLIVQEVKDETLVYDLKINKALCLNQTVAFVWKNCDGNKSVEEIRISLAKQVNAKVDTNLVLFALDELKNNKLIENDLEAIDQFERMSRCEIIRKVGLSAMIALPIIVTVTAPEAVFAQSCAPAPFACGCPNGTGNGNFCGQGAGGQPCAAGCRCRSTGNLVVLEIGDCVP